MAFFVGVLRHADFDMDTGDIIKNGLGYELVSQLSKILKNLGYEILEKVYACTNKEEEDGYNVRNRVFQTARLLGIDDVCADFCIKADNSNIDFKGIIEDFVEKNKGLNYAEKDFLLIIVTHQEQIGKLADIKSKFVEQKESGEFFMATVGEDGIPLGGFFIIESDSPDAFIKGKGKYKGKIYQCCDNNEIKTDNYKWENKLSPDYVVMAAQPLLGKERCGKIR